MAKQGMARTDRTHSKPKNEMPPVPELQGKAKTSKEPANPVVSGTSGSNQKVVHTERPISKAYPVIDNNLSASDVQD